MTTEQQQDKPVSGGDEMMQIDRLISDDDNMVRDDANEEDGIARQSPVPGDNGVRDFEESGNQAETISEDAASAKRAADGEIDKSKATKRQKGEPRGRAKKIHEKTTALEIARLDPTRELGIFQTGNKICVKLAGLQEPTATESAEVKARFRAAVAAAITVMEVDHGDAEWWRPMAENLNLYLGHQKTCSGKEYTMEQLLKGIEIGEIQSINKADEKKSVRQGRPDVARQFLDARNMMEEGRSVWAPRGTGERTKPSKSRKSAKEMYPELESDHPNWQKVFTKKDLINLILQHPYGKQTRHQKAPAYFNARGYLYEKGAGKELVKEWVEGLERISAEDVEWPENMPTQKMMLNCLARYNQTVAKYASDGMVNSIGRIRQTPLTKTKGGRDEQTGKFAPGKTLTEVGERELIAKTLKIDNKKSGQRTDVVRDALQKSVQKVAEGLCIQDQRNQAVLTVVRDMRVQDPRIRQLECENRALKEQLWHVGERMDVFYDDLLHQERYSAKLKQRLIDAGLQVAEPDLPPETFNTSAWSNSESDESDESDACGLKDHGHEFSSEDEPAYDDNGGPSDDIGMFVSRTEAADLIWDEYSDCVNTGRKFCRGWKVVWPDDTSAKEQTGPFEIIDTSRYENQVPPPTTKKGKLW